jgi:hypothetical protein
MGALGFALALPLSFPVPAATADGVGVSASAAGDYAPQTAAMPAQWRSYALASITPSFSWAIRPNAERSVPNVLVRYGAGTDTRFLLDLGAQPQTRLTVSFQSGLVSDTPAPRSSLLDTSIVQSGPGIERSVIAPSLNYRLGEASSVSVSAIFAQQRFATLGMGIADLDYLPASAILRGNESYGAGGRIDLEGSPVDRWHWTAGYQSRVNMDAFNNYRGVFAEPGKFDIPANANIGIGYDISPLFGVDLGVERIMYSDITPFTSQALPTRVLALLGDGASPAFEWQDLTVYSLGGTLRHPEFGDFALRYTTRQQPEPTSNLLKHALATDAANYTVSFGWSRHLSANAQLGFLASYAASPYFLGIPSYRAPEDGYTQRLEFEAYWLTRF